MILQFQVQYYLLRNFGNFLCARYNVSPVKPPIHCDKCGTAFGVTHVLIFRIGGLVVSRHNKIRDEILYLYRCALTSASISAEPLIHQGRTRSEQEICQDSDKHKETKGDVVIGGIWDRQVKAIIDVKLGDADADMDKYKPMKSLLARW